MNKTIETHEYDFTITKGSGVCKWKVYSDIPFARGYGLTKRGAIWAAKSDLKDEIYSSLLENRSQIKIQVKIKRKGANR